jgi:hypothetical protein
MVNYQGVVHVATRLSYELLKADSKVTSRPSAYISTATASCSEKNMRIICTYFLSGLGIFEDNLEIVKIWNTSPYNAL